MTRGGATVDLARRVTCFRQPTVLVHELGSISIEVVCRFDGQNEKPCAPGLRWSYRQGRTYRSIHVARPPSHGSDYYHTLGLIGAKNQMGLVSGRRLEILLSQTTTRVSRRFSSSWYTRSVSARDESTRYDQDRSRQLDSTRKQIRIIRQNDRPSSPYFPSADKRPPHKRKPLQLTCSKPLASRLPQTSNPFFSILVLYLKKYAALFSLV